MRKQHINKHINNMQTMYKSVDRYKPERQSKSTFGISVLNELFKSIKPLMPSLSASIAEHTIYLSANGATFGRAAIIGDSIELATTDYVKAMSTEPVKVLIDDPDMLDKLHIAIIKIKNI